jgi:NAD(P)-dependent dehydrogenase (short-subunit alcohol dehydrogenase family)
VTQRGDRGIAAARNRLAAWQSRRGEQQIARILVTGATRGLGRALVTELSRRDHQVVATGRRLADLADLPATERLVLDLTNPASIDQAMAAAGRLAVVINNAAMTVSGPVEAVPASLVEQVLATNVLGPLRVMQAALPTMREQAPAGS